MQNTRGPTAPARGRALLLRAAFFLMTTLPSSPAAAPVDGRPGPAEGDRAPAAQGERALVDAALAGNEAALHRLATLLTPPVQARVARALLRRRGLYRGDARARLEDLVQDTFVELFRDGGRVLRAWDEARGLSLVSFAGLVAEQRVLAFLRTRKASARLEDLDDDDEAWGARPDARAWDPEARAASREHLRKLLDHIRAELSPMGRVLFDRLVVNEEDIASVARDMNMSTSAVQAWSSRLKRRTAALAREIAGEAEAAGEGGAGVRKTVGS